MKYSILLVDDDPNLRELLRQMLELGGYDVEEAEDGVEALEKVEIEPPDALILDVMMPNMDGISVCKTLRAGHDTSHIPIIMLSGKTQKKAVEEGLAAGANKYLCKPIAFDDLILSLRAVLTPANAPIG